MSEEILLISVATALVVMPLMLVISQVKHARMRRALTSQALQVETLKNDVSALFSGAVGEDARIYKLEMRTRRIIERQEQLETTKNAERPYRTHGYPVTPFIFVAITTWFVINIMINKPLHMGVGIIFLLIGVPVFLVFRKIHST